MLLNMFEHYLCIIFKARAEEECIVLLRRTRAAMELAARTHRMAHLGAYHALDFSAWRQLSRVATETHHDNCVGPCVDGAPFLAQCDAPQQCRRLTAVKFSGPVAVQASILHSDGDFDVVGRLLRPNPDAGARKSALTLCVRWRWKLGKLQLVSVALRPLVPHGVARGASPEARGR